MYFVFIFAAQAQEVNLNPEKKKYAHAINANAISWTGGVFIVNYELLLVQRHGLLVEFSYANTWGFTSNTYNGTRGSLQYRWHFSEGMDSVFIGVFGSYYAGYSSISALKIGNTYYPDLPYQLKKRGFAFGLNVGRRWVWNNGVNLAVRIGYGPAFVRVDSSRSEQPFLDIAESSGKDEKFRGGFDWDLSVGYTF